MKSRIHGMLIGSALGDAAGGPVEFQAYEAVRDHLPDCRNWLDERRLNDGEIEQLATSLRLLPYGRFRPTAEPYGQWTDDAPSGTVTDDTRHKMVLISALRRAKAEQRLPLMRESLAEEYLKVDELREFQVHSNYGALLHESFREFVLAARWVVGERDEQTALPPQRIWGGLSTCCGQMALTPLAALYPGRPSRAYQAAYDLAFMDQGTARDTNAAIVAGLAEGLALPPMAADAAFQRIRQAMVTTDPYRYRDIPYIQRPIQRWLVLAEQCVSESQGRPKELYRRLKSALNPHYFWEARFTLGAAWALLKVCRWNPLAAIHLAMDMGHDTDSVGQLIGLLGGAALGTEVFPKTMRDTLADRLLTDYRVSIDEWTELFVSLSKMDGSKPRSGGRC